MLGVPAGLIAPAAEAAAIAAAAPAAAVAASAAGAAPAAAAVFARLGLVDRQGPAAGVLAVEGRDRCLSLLVASHLDEPEPFGTAGVPVHDHLGRLHGPVGREHRFQVGVGHPVIQVADIQLLTHNLTRL